MITRKEADSIGTMEVPMKAYYGVQTLRAKKNFHITGRPLHPEFIKNLVRIKKGRGLYQYDGPYTGREDWKCHCKGL